MLATKQCTLCNTIKDLSEFNSQKDSNDGLQYSCRICMSSKRRAYYQTKDGLVNRLYGHQIESSIKRGHTKPTYNRQELKDWLYSQKKFHLLYDNWKRLDYQKNYSPSVDRKDDYIGYTMDNIQLMTWKQNASKGWHNRVHGINNKVNKTVLQYTKSGNFIRKYHSSHDASRKTGINRGNLSSCCRGNTRQKSAGGFIWKYAD